MSVKNSFWRDAAMAGLVVGVALSAIQLLSVMKLPSFVVLLMQIAVLIGSIYYFGKKRAAKHGDEGFTFGNVIGYAIAFMMLAGIFEGFTTFLIVTYITPELVEQSIAQTIALQGIDTDSDQAVLMAKMTRMMMKNPVVVILSAMFGSVIRGGIIALFVAPFVKRNPNPFAGGQHQEDKVNENKMSDEQ